VTDGLSLATRAVVRRLASSMNALILEEFQEESLHVRRASTVSLPILVLSLFWYKLTSTVYVRIRRAAGPPPSGWGWPVRAAGVRD